jgi:hypothetical protein
MEAHLQAQETPMEMDRTIWDRKRDLGHLNTVQNMKEAFERFDYKEDDVLPRREQVKMFRMIEEEMKREINDLCCQERMDAYDKGKELSQRLSMLQDGFAGLQTKEMERVQQTQSTHFRRAHKYLTNTIAEKHKAEHERVNQVVTDKIDDVAQLHDIEQENLELELSLTKKPRMKFSRRLLELKKAESELIKLSRFDEAKNVRRMINKVQPTEIQQFDKEFEDRLDARRRKLSKWHESDTKRNDELVSAIRWKNIQNCNTEKTTTEWRLRQHEHDMDHSHVMDRHKSPELSIHPSHLLQRRASYEHTGASLRGTQLLGAVKGKKKNQAVFVAGLCDIHSFSKPLSGTEQQTNYSLYDAGPKRVSPAPGRGLGGEY